MTTSPDGDDGEAGQPPQPPDTDDEADRADVTRLDEGRIPRDQRPADANQAPDADPTRLDPGRIPGHQARGDETRLDPGRRRDQADWGDGRLPAALASRFALIEELPARAAQATVFLVSEHGADRQRVIKLYHAHVVPNQRVWTWLRQQAASPAGNHIVKVFETDFTAGRAYEVMEYLAGGDLYNLPQPAPLRGDPDLLREIAGQVATALAAAHAAGISHRDVKPANILIRSLEPIDVALADFGIGSEVGLAGHPHPTQSMTPQYAAPEWLGGKSLSPAVDWWALGITIAELAGGHHPFDQMPREVILKHFLNARPVNLAQVSDPRLRLLCRGLLIPDEADRWGGEQVEQWYRGESPEVPDHGGAATDEDESPDDQSAKPFSYFGNPYYTPAGLAHALASEWEVAAGYFFGTKDTHRSHRQDLRQWLACLDEPSRPAGGAEEFDKLAKGHDKADIKLHRLLRWLSPNLRPVYRTAVVTIAELPALAQQGISGQPEVALSAGQVAARDVIRDLWDADLLLDLATAPGGSGLAETDDRWRQLEERWRYFTTELRRRDRHVGSLLKGVPRDTVLCYLLWLASAEAAAHTHLRSTATAARAGLPEALPWFSSLTRADADVLNVLCAVLLAGPALSESQQIADDRDAARQARRRSLALRAVELWYRKHDRPTALGWAGAGITVVAVAWSWSIGLSDVLPFASANMVDLAWICAVLSLIVFAAAELWLATVIGGPYHTRYSLIGATLSRAGRAARPLLRSGPLALAILISAILALAAATIFVPFLLPVLTTAGEIAWIRRRHQQWLSDEQDRADERRLAAREWRAEHGQAAEIRS